MKKFFKKNKRLVITLLCCYLLIGVLIFMATRHITYILGN